MARLFGVEVLYQLHRALDVREQRGDGLALALQIFGGECIGYQNLTIVECFRRGR
jgi:hypothetical protein